MGQVEGSTGGAPDRVNPAFLGRKLLGRLPIVDPPSNEVKSLDSDGKGTTESVQPLGPPERRAAGIPGSVPEPLPISGVRTPSGVVSVRREAPAIPGGTIQRVSRRSEGPPAPLPAEEVRDIAESVIDQSAGKAANGSAPAAAPDASHGNTERRNGARLPAKKGTESYSEEPEESLWDVPSMDKLLTGIHNGDLPQGKLSKVIAADLRNTIENGDLPNGTRLPSTKAAQKKGYSPRTLLDAYQILADEGIVIKGKAGTMVYNNTPENTVNTPEEIQPKGDQRAAEKPEEPHWEVPTLNKLFVKAYEGEIPKGTISELLASELSATIENDELPDGTHLPPIKDAKGKGFSPATLYTAYKALEKLGYIKMNGTHGTIIKRRKPEDAKEAKEPEKASKKTQQFEIDKSDAYSKIVNTYRTVSDAAQSLEPHYWKQGSTLDSAVAEKTGIAVAAAHDLLVVNRFFRALHCAFQPTGNITTVERYTGAVLTRINSIVTEAKLTPSEKAVFGLRIGLAPDLSAYTDFQIPVNDGGTSSYKSAYEWTESENNGRNIPSLSSYFHKNPTTIKDIWKSAVEKIKMQIRENMYRSNILNPVKADI